MFYLFIFLNPLNIYESNTLKWVPILICIMSMFLSGWINRSLSIKLLPILFLPFIVFHLFNFAYFPFIAILILTGMLMLFVTRENQISKYKFVGGILTASIFLFFLFAQPLIVTQKGFGYADDGALVNANILWDFTKKEDIKLPDHDLKDVNANNYNMTGMKGKTYFVTFWATWCAPCIEEKPKLDKLKQTYNGNQEIEFIDISFDYNNDKWIQFVEKNSPLGLQLVAEDQKTTSRLLGFEGIPMHLIVTENGFYKKYRSFETAQTVIHNIFME